MLLVDGLVTYLRLVFFLPAYPREIEVGIHINGYDLYELCPYQWIRSVWIRSVESLTLTFFKVTDGCQAVTVPRHIHQLSAPDTPSQPDLSIYLYLF